jgi:hypothetical protein
MVMGMVMFVDHGTAMRVRMLVLSGFTVRSAITGLAHCILLFQIDYTDCPS